MLVLVAYRRATERLYIIVYSVQCKYTKDTLLLTRIASEFLVSQTQSFQTENKAFQEEACQRQGCQQEELRSAYGGFGYQTPLKIYS